MVGQDDTGAPEFEEVFTPVEVRSTRNYSRQLMFRVDEETDKSLERLAEERGMKSEAYGRSIRELESEDIAAAVVYAVTQPPHVSINEILVRPTDQVR